MTRTEVYTFVSAHRLGVLGSVSPEGMPQSALVGIALTEELEIVFDTLSSTRKYRNLTLNPAVSFSIGWGGERTVQMDGTAVLPDGEELRRYQEVYFRTWPECAAHQSWPGIAYVVVRPRWIRYSSYEGPTPCIEEMLF